MNKGRKIALISLLIAIAAIFLYFVKPNSSGIINYPSENTGVLAFGDSLVYGTGSTQGGGFVKMLSDELGVSIVNLGISGDTTKDALGRVSEVARRKPALVILLIGGNDFLLGIHEEETFKNIERIIEAIQASGAAVLLVGLESEVIGDDYSEIFETLVRKHKTAYVPDILDGIFGNRALMSDALHPNDAGYRLMAERIKPVLENLID